MTPARTDHRGRRGPGPADDAAPEGGSWSYGPGGWYAVLAGSAAVLLPPGERARAGALWAAADDGADVDALLDALLADGLRDLPGFALVAVDGADVRVLARGEVSVACATDDGPVAMDGRGAASWRERRLPGVESTRVVLGEAAPPTEDAADEGAPPPCVVGTALVRAAWVAHPAARAEPDAPAPPAQPPAAEGPAVPASAEPASAVPAARLVLSSGEVVEVDRVVLLGRDPEARPGLDPELEPGREPGEPRLVRVVSPQHEVSSTHLEVRPVRGDDEAVVVVTDLGSTNGTLVGLPGRAPAELQPWTPLPLAPGAVVDLGDGLTVQVAGS